MKVFITGANGYIGQYLTKTARDTGHSVTTLTRKPYPIPDTHNRVSKNNNHEELTEFLKEQNIIVHLAAYAHQSTKSSPGIEHLYQQVNVKNTLQIARAAKQVGVKRFIFISSIKVNGERTDGRPFKSSDTPNPEDAYGRSKYAAEQELKILFSDGDTELVIIRPPLVWGGNMKGNLAFLEKLIKWHIPLPFKSIKNSRSVVSCANLCALILHVLEHPAAKGQVFMVSDDANRSTAQIITLIANQIGVHPLLIPCPVVLLKALYKFKPTKRICEKLIGNLEVDITATKEILQWSPKN